MPIAYLDGSRLRRALIAACDHTERCRAELNRINVYPVPDGDTGTNLALTARSIADGLRATREREVGAVARRAADAGILGARGNCGMILSHFLLGFSAAVEGRKRLSVSEFVVALRRAADHVYAALERPVEGTILTVIRETTEEAERAQTSDFAELLDRLVARAREALARTPELLPVLRNAGVVDAGAKGFVHLLEGVLHLIRGDSPAAAATSEGARIEVDDDGARSAIERVPRGRLDDGAVTAVDGGSRRGLDDGAVTSVDTGSRRGLDAPGAAPASPPGTARLPAPGTDRPLAAGTDGRAAAGIAPPPATGTDLPQSAAAARVDVSDQYRFCTEALVRGDALPPADVVRSALAGLGDSLIVIRGADVLKVHVHTDDPDTVFARLREFGELAAHKAEDMHAQHAAIERAAASHVHLARRPVAIVTDSVADLPDEVVRAHGIHVVPVSLVYGDESLRDRVDIDPDTFVERLRRGERPTTSQPPPAAFLEAYARAAEDGEHVLAVLLASALSGTYASGETAARMFEGAPVTVVDSRGASLTEGLLVLRAAELAELGTPVAEIVAELDRIRDRSGILFTIETFDNLLASGRVSRGQAWLASSLRIRPILGLTAEGRIVPVAKVVGPKRVLPRMLDLIRERATPGQATVRFGIIHVGRPEIVPAVRAALLEHYPDAEIIASPASPALATHAGPGAWGIAYQVEAVEG